MPVDITNLPGPDKLALPAFHYEQATFWVALIAFLVACYAAWYAKEAFKAAEADLKISQTSLAIAQRRPALVASLTTRGQYVSYQGNPPYQVLTVEDAFVLVTVANGDAGERRCDAFFIEIRVPLSALSLAASARQMDQGLTYFPLSKVVTDTVLFPSGEAKTISFNVPLDYVTEDVQAEIEYRLKDDFTTYPARGYFKAMIDLPKVDKSTIIAPRDEAEGILKRVADSKRLLITGEGFAKYVQGIQNLNALGRVPSAERMAKAKEIVATF